MRAMTNFSERPAPDGLTKLHVNERQVEHARELGPKLQNLGFFLSHRSESTQRAWQRCITTVSGTTYQCKIKDFLGGTFLHLPIFRTHVGIRPFVRVVLEQSDNLVMALFIGP